MEHQLEYKWHLTKDLEAAGLNLTGGKELIFGNTTLKRLVFDFRYYVLS